MVDGVWSMEWLTKGPGNGAFFMGLKDSRLAPGR